MKTFQTDIARSAGSQLLINVVTTAADELMMVDIRPTATPGKHWVVEQLCLIASLTARAPSTPGGYPPISGLFLCPTDTPPETNAAAITDNWTQAARPFLLPMGLPGGDFAELGTAPPYAMAFVLSAGMRVTVPFGWFLRAILICAAGTATPGPGAGSIGTFRALAYQESDQACV